MLQTVSSSDLLSGASRLLVLALAPWIFLTVSDLFLRYEA